MRVKFATVPKRLIAQRSAFSRSTRPKGAAFWTFGEGHVGSGSPSGRVVLGKGIPGLKTLSQNGAKIRNLDISTLWPEVEMSML
jgi:hypothetical protein